MEVYRFEQCLGERFSPLSTFFSLVGSCAFKDAPHSRFRSGNPNQYLPNFLKDATFSPPPNLHACISLVEVYRFEQWFGERFSHLSTSYSLVSSPALRDAPHSRFRCRNLNQCSPNFFKDATFSPPLNLHKYISLVEVCRFGQCLGERFSPISTFLF